MPPYRPLENWKKLVRFKAGWGGDSCVTNLDQTKDKLQFFTPMLYEILVLVISWSQPHFWRQGVVYVPSISNCCCFGVANIVKKYQEKITHRKRIHVKRNGPEHSKDTFFSHVGRKENAHHGGLALC